MNEKPTAAHIKSFPDLDPRTLTGGFLTVLSLFDETPWNMPRPGVGKVEKVYAGSDLLHRLLGRL